MNLTPTQLLKALNRSAVFNIVRSMNWNYGRGDLLTLQWHSLNGGYAVVKPHGMREEKTPFTVEVNNGKAYIRYKNRKRLYRDDA